MCIAAAIWAGYELEQFRALSGAQQSELIAAYESEAHITSVLMEHTEKTE